MRSASYVLLLVGTADGTERVWYPRGHKQNPLDQLQPQILDLYQRPEGCTNQCMVNITGDAEQAIEGEMLLNTNCFKERFLQADPGQIDPEGFLLIANNKLLDSWEHPPWIGPNWVVVRFNHCAARWPQGEVRREFIAQSTACEGRNTTAERVVHHGGQQAQDCADMLGHPVFSGDILSVGGTSCESRRCDNRPCEHSCDLPWMRAGPEGKVLSSGGTVVLTLAHFYPSTLIVAAGFDQEASGLDSTKQGPWEGHAWDYEAEVFQALTDRGRLRVLRTQEDMRAVGGALRNSTGARALR